MTEKEVVVVKGRELHCVFKETWTGSKTSTWHIKCSRIFKSNSMSNIFEINAMFVGDHIKLIGSGKFDVAPRVRKQFRQFGLFWCRHNYSLRQQSKKFTRTLNSRRTTP